MLQDSDPRPRHGWACECVRVGMSARARACVFACARLCVCARACVCTLCGTISLSRRGEATAPDQVFVACAAEAGGGPAIPLRLWIRPSLCTGPTSAVGLWIAMRHTGVIGDWVPRLP